MSEPRAPPPRPTSEQQLDEVESEIERWESLLEEPETRWDSFKSGGKTRAAPISANSNAAPTSSPPAHPPASRSVHFPSDIENSINPNDITSQPYVYNDMNMSVSEQLTSTMEQLIEKNVLLTEELDKQRSKTEQSLTTLNTVALKEKNRADDAQEGLSNLRSYVSDYLSAPTETKVRTMEEEQFWENIATTNIVESSNVPLWFEPSEVPAKIVMPLFSGEADNFRAGYQRMMNENRELKEEVERLKRVVDTRRPMIQKLATAAKNQALTHKRQLMAAVRRIDYLVQERDEAVKKKKELEKYVTKLEMKTLQRKPKSVVRTKENAPPNNGRRGPTRPASKDMNMRLNPTRTKPMRDGRTGDTDHIMKSIGVDKTKVAKLYAAASEICKKGTEENLRNAGREGRSRGSPENVVEGRRKMELARKPKNTATMNRGGGAGEEVSRGKRGVNSGSNRSSQGRNKSTPPPVPRRNHPGYQDVSAASPTTLEQTLLESIILDEEGVEAEGVAMATARLQKEFSSYYEEENAKKTAETVVPLPLER